MWERLKEKKMNELGVEKRDEAALKRRKMIEGVKELSSAEEATVMRL